MRVIDVEQLWDITLMLRDPSEIEAVVTPLASAGVNVESVCCEGGGGPLTCHLLVSTGEAARRVLTAHGVEFALREVAVFTLQNRPGTLAGVMRALREAGVRIDFMYQATMKGLVIGAADTSAVRSALLGAPPEMAQAGAATATG